MIARFRDEFLALLKAAPWYFTKVTGLNEIWQIDPANSFRGKDKKLTFETEEAIDLKMTYLLDLYRKAVFDPVWMRYALPENQRMFSMELIIGDIRPLHISQPGFQSLKNGNYPGKVDTSLLGSSFETFESNVDQTAAETNSFPNVFGRAPTFPELSLVTSIRNSLKALKNTKNQSSEAYPTIKAPWSPTTFLSFRFEYCTFDVFSTSPDYLESLEKVSSKEPAKNSFIINTPFISEVNNYGLLGAVLKDSYYQGDYNYDINDTDRYSPRILQTLGEGKPGNVRTQIRKQDEVKSRLLRNLTTAAEARIRNIVERAVNRRILGNVYRASPLSILNTIQGFLNNPLEIATATLASFMGTASNGPATLGNVVLTGEEAQLVKDVIGVAIEDGVLENPNLVSDRIGTTVEDDILSNPNLVTADRRNVNLTGPDIVKERLGNVYGR